MSKHYDCDCEDWKYNLQRIDSALVLANVHGFEGMNKSFTYCPFCGKKLTIRNSKLSGKRMKIKLNMPENGIELKGGLKK